MTTSTAQQIGITAADRLRERSVCAIEPGLSDREFATIEAEFGIEFADDHRAFLAVGLPVNTIPEPHDPNASYAWDRPWPDWRNGGRDELRRQLDWPISGVLFDVEHGLWLHEWGSRPTVAAEALVIAQEQLAKVPKLIPVYAHRFLPAGRGSYNHPVLSVWQTDIIYYGLNLHDYIAQEFGPPRRDDTWNPEATVAFWSQFLE